MAIQECAELGILADVRKDLWKLTCRYEIER